MNFDLNAFVKIGPVISGLLVMVACWAYRWFKSKPVTVEDMFVVGITGSSFPSGVLFVIAAFDSSLLAKVSEAPVYIGIAGCAVLYIAGKTVREKGAA
ncbi:hypothetical protein OL229_15970 [Neisseriaceae bacterium JH1-16]|nr:hypothetical protein [Neisseriaceae bacterium JH1-16]